MNAIVKTESLPIQRMADLEAVGSFIAQSGMFGIRNPAEGFVVAATCHQQGISLMQFKETYHIIHGTPSKRADAMRAKLLEMGGSYEIIERTAIRAAIKASFGKASGTFSFSWEEALLEPFIYKGKESDVVPMLIAGKPLMIKDKYATPRSRMQMLWARDTSDMVRAICPGANKGTYTPEEVSDFAEPRGALTTLTPAEATARATSAAVVVEDASVAEYCPVGGPEMIGKKWDEFDDEMLNQAFNSKLPEITDDHRECIAIIQENRKAERGA